MLPARPRAAVGLVTVTESNPPVDPPTGEAPRSADAPAADDRPHRARGPSARPVLAGFGLVFLLAAFWPAALRVIDENFGIVRLISAALGFGFLYLVTVSREVARTRERLLDLMEQVLKLFYGPNFRRDRQAVDILVRGMRSSDVGVQRSSLQHLRRLTGEDKGDDPDAWEEWWLSARSTFRAASTERQSDARS